MHDDPRLVRQLIQAGVSGYLVKSAGRDELHAAVTAAARRDGSVMVSVSRSTASALTSDAAVPAGPLTARELEVLQLLAEGGSNRMIAGQLHIAEATVKRHLTAIFAKLEAQSRTQVIKNARLLGLIIDA